MLGWFSILSIKSDSFVVLFSQMPVNKRYVSDYVLQRPMSRNISRRQDCSSYLTMLKRRGVRLLLLGFGICLVSLQVSFHPISTDAGIRETRTWDINPCGVPVRVGPDDVCCSAKQHPIIL